MFYKFYSWAQLEFKYLGIKSFGGSILSRLKESSSILVMLILSARSHTLVSVSRVRVSAPLSRNFEKSANAFFIFYFLTFVAVLENIPTFGI